MSVLQIFQTCVLTFPFKNMDCLYLLQSSHAHCDGIYRCLLVRLVLVALGLCLVAFKQRFVLTLNFIFKVQHCSVQSSCSVVSDSATPWTAARQASLSITNSLSLLKLMSVDLVMPSNHFILCHPLLLLPSVLLPSIRVFSNESVFYIRWPKYWSFSSNCLLIMITMLASRQPHKTVA